MTAPPTLRRWRLALGRFAEPAAGGLAGGDAARDTLLQRVYGRGVRQADGGRDASLGPSQLTLFQWLDEVRQLFPNTVAETVQAHAIDHYGMAELLTDPQVLAAVAPSQALLRSLLAVKDRANPAVQEAIRRVARAVVEDLLRRLKPKADQALLGPRSRRPGRRRRLADLDWRGTVRGNLKNWDRDRQVLVAEHLRFLARARRTVPWTVVICLDQSGSMASSVIHTACMAAILAGLPAVSVRLVVFDTSVVDLSDRVADPVGVLLSVQLGGGTMIGQALEYCEQRHLQQPSRTILVLVSDFIEGDTPRRMLAAVKRMASARVTLLGLAALDEEARPDYDKAAAQQLAAAGMAIAALTPERFAEWIAERLR